MSRTPKEVEMLFDQVSDLLTRVSRLRDDVKALNCSPIIKETELFRAAAAISDTCDAYVPQWDNEGSSDEILLKLNRDKWDILEAAIARVRQGGV